MFLCNVGSTCLQILYVKKDQLQVMSITSKNSSFWDVTPRDQGEIYQCFGGIFRAELITSDHYHGKKLSRSRVPQ
jgi:hypothetical protein